VVAGWGDQLCVCVESVSLYITPPTFVVYFLRKPHKCVASRVFSSSPYQPDVPAPIVEACVSTGWMAQCGHASCSVFRPTGLTRYGLTLVGSTRDNTHLFDRLLCSRSASSHFVFFYDFCSSPRPQMCTIKFICFTWSFWPIVDGMCN
jgi:hypothetical protein